MYLVLYSNKAYEHMVSTFLASRKYCGGQDYTVIFYTVGYDSDLEFPNLIKRRWDPVIERQNFQLYKPHIMLQSLEFETDMIYFDTDILLGSRFDPEYFRHSNDYPLACAGPIEYVFTWEKDPDGNVTEFTERLLMDYFGVKDRTTFYLWTSMLSYNMSCRDFLQEWCSIVDNSYFHRDGKLKMYMPFGDETPFNVLMWKRGCTEYLPRHFVNTSSSDTVVSIETEEKLRIGEDFPYGIIHPTPSMYEKCDDSSLVQFYHGMKDPNELIKTLSWMIQFK